MLRNADRWWMIFPAIILLTPSATAFAATPATVTVAAIVAGATFTVKLVIALLLGISIVSWGVLVAKVFQLRRAFGLVHEAHERLIEANSLHDVAEIRDGAVQWLLASARGEMEHSRTLVSAGLTGGATDRVALVLARAEDHLARRISSGVSFFATAGSVTPFVGLFGTVWGIMHSFMGIAQANSTSLAVVAPGIAEALLATAIGLVVAIPATVMYNVIGKMVDAYCARLTDCSAAIICMASRDVERMRPQRGSPRLALAEA